MKASTERLSFSTRLREALKNADYPSDSPTQLAREFNVRFAGSPITVHAARKWLVGEAIPTQEKLRILADWLSVPADWLRFGGQLDPSSVPAGMEERQRFETADVKLLTDLQKLDDHHRVIAREFLRMLARVGRHSE